MIVQKNMKKCYPSLRRVCLAVSRQLGPSNSGQESSAAAVLACAIMPSEVQKNMKKCYPAHPSNVSASRCRGSLLCPSNSRQKGRNTQPPFNPSVGSLCHFCATATRFSYRFPIFETSATALCGTTGMIEGSLEVKLPTIWTDEKQSREEAERRERLEERRVEEKESEERRCRCAKR